MSKRTRRTAEKGKLSDQLRAFIESSDLSMYRISREIDVGAPTLTRFMKHQSGLSLDTLDKLGEVLGLQLVLRKDR